MTAFFQSRWSAILSAFALVWLLGIGVFQMSGVRQSVSLQADSIHHDAGCAYAVALKERPSGWPFTRFVCDSASVGQASELILLRDGHRFGQSHALHQEIRDIGEGRYSHWGDTLYFSLPDCGEPRAEKNAFVALIPVELAKWTKLSAFVLGLFLIVWLMHRYSDHGYVRRAVLLYHKSLDVLLGPWELGFDPAKNLFFLTALGVLAGAYLVWIWGSGRSVSIAVGGSYQVSDAMAYWTCANALLDLGNFGNSASFTSDWCQRRTIYPTLLSGMAWLAQRNIFGTLILQAGIVCLGIFVVARRASAYAGVVGLLVVSGLLLLYASADLFPLTMTENAGLVFGCLGVAVLLGVTETKSAKLMASGIALVSIALNARAGAFFVLPLLVLWAGIVGYIYSRRIWQWVLVATLSATVGFLLQALLVLAVGGSPSSSHGNFSYVLYGLSVGGMGWQQVLVEHPELTGSDALMSKAVYALAWNNIKLQPQLFLHGLARNLETFLLAGTYGYQRLGQAGILVQICWWLGWVPLLANLRRPAYLLIALASLGVIASVPFLIGDGGPRVFAATVAIDAIQIGLGFYLLASIAKRIASTGSPVAFRRELSNPSAISSAGMSMEIFVTGFVLVFLMIPHIKLFIDAKAIPFPDYPACKSSEYQVVTYIGGNSSMLLGMVDDGQQIQVLRGDVSKEGFASGIPSSSWYRNQVMAFKGTTLLSAYQLDRSDASAPGPYLATSNVLLSQQYYGRMARLCVDKHEQEVIFDTPYRRINSIVALE